jgi:hypothetical protein
LSSGEVSRLWEEPTEAISRKRVAVGIAAIYGGEDVNEQGSGLIDGQPMTDPNTETLGPFDTTSSSS